jgi:predicted RNA-binding protein with PIN domain
MAILIDGYNLLHATDVFCDHPHPQPVEKLHQALIDHLLTLIDAAEASRTTIVFDAKGRRARARRQLQYRNVTVHYSARSETADTLIDELIQLHPAPRQLTVVSSDHQVHRSARRRKAKAIDSEVWYAQQVRRKRARTPIDQAARPIPSESVEFPPEILVAIKTESSPIPQAPFPASYLADVEREWAAGNTKGCRHPRKRK